MWAYVEGYVVRDGDTGRRSCRVTVQRLAFSERDLLKTYLMHPTFVYSTVNYMNRSRHVYFILLTFRYICYTRMGGFE